LKPIVSFFYFQKNLLNNSKEIAMPLSKMAFLLLFSLLFTNCTEPYELETNTYEEALIVQATITNELKRHEITLTKSSRFEDTETQIESDAAVYITDNTGNRYDFEEESGKYISTSEFQAIPDREYRLNIQTKDGRTFESVTEKLTTINPIQNVTATVEMKDNENGVAIRVNSYDPTNQSKYYRYEYEETYKVVTPNWSQLTPIITFPPNGANPTIYTVPNDPDTKICYGSQKNTDILITSTNELNEDRVDFLARFISDQNYILSHRYSILVRQYVESLAAYTYYKTLKKISGEGSLLSPLQPGNLNGNIASTNNIDDKIIGYFDVASVSTERIYFNYSDLFPNQLLPPYYTTCEPQTLAWCFKGLSCNGDDLAYYFDTKTIMIYYSNVGNSYTVYPYPCGDCTSIASKIKPPFWID
jgi:hypothetical protein